MTERRASLRQTVRALAYLDWKLAVNRWRATLRSGWRLLAYIPLIAFLLAGVVARLSRHNQANPLVHLPSGSVPALLSFLPGIVAVTVGGVVVGAARLSPVRFTPQSPEAYLVPGSAMPSRVFILWRLIKPGVFIAALPRSILYLLLAPNTFGLSRPLVIGLMLISRAVPVAFNGFAFALFRFKRRYRWLPLREMGWTLVGIGLLSLGGAVLVYLHQGGEAVRTGSRLLNSIPPGSLFLQAVLGSRAGVALLVALAVTGAAMVWVSAGDCYPEMFEATSLILKAADARGSAAVRDSLRGGRARSSAGFGPRGAGVILWRWVVIHRRTMNRGTFVGYGVVVVLGLIVGYAVRVGPHWLGLGAVTLLGIAVSADFTGANDISLADELRTPMWHLLRGGEAARLRALCLGRAAENLIGMALLVAGFTLAMPWVLPAIVPAVVALAALRWLRESVGVIVVLLNPAGLQPGTRAGALQLLMVPAMVALVVQASIFYLHEPWGWLLLVGSVPALVIAGMLLTGLGARLVEGHQVTLAASAAR